MPRPQGPPPAGRPFALAALVLVVGTAAVAGLPHRGAPIPGLADGTPVRLVLVTAAATLAGVFGVLCLLRWRWVGEAASLQVGTATMVLAAGSLLGGDVLGVLVSSPAAAEALAGAQLACLAAAVWLLAGALAPPDAGRRTGAARLVGWIATFVAAATLAVLWWPPGPPGRLGVLTPALENGDVAVRLIASGACVVLAVAYTGTGLHRRRWMLTWLGLGLFALALAHCFAALAGRPDDRWLTGAAGFQLLGMLLAVNGGSHDLREAWKEQESRLSAAHAELRVREVQRQAERAREEERAHDARSVIAAVQGAVLALEEDHDGLGAHQRSALARALGEELRRLQRLLQPVPEDELVQPYDVAAALEPVVRCHRSGGSDIAAELPPGLVALGRPHDLAEVVQNLLDNARRHAPGSPVVVRAGTELGNVVVRVEDRGPGVEAPEREAIFGRGRRGSTGSPGGSGLGLYVGRRLMRRQGGDLWVEGRPGGGASFTLYLPGFQVPPLPPGPPRRVASPPGSLAVSSP